MRSSEPAGVPEPTAASVRRARTPIMLSAGDQGRPGTWLWIAAGGGNDQTLINAVLRELVERRREPLEETLRRVIREELRTA